MVNIAISYKLVHDNNWITITLSPDDYFLPDQEDDISIDSIPAYDHAIDYLVNISYLEIKSTLINLSDNESNQSITITETFWNTFKNRIIERIDSGLSVTYNEIIVQSIINDHPNVTEVIRFVREDNGCLTPVYHGLITDNADGSQSENKVL